MYLLSLSKKPFAIIKEPFKITSIHKAIKEEFALVELNTTGILLPDWGDCDYFSFTGFDEFGTELKKIIQITKLASY